MSQSMQGHGSKKNNKFLFQWWINWITSKYQPGKHIYWQWTVSPCDVLHQFWPWFGLEITFIDYMPFHCGASQYESSNVFHLVMRIYINCNHHGSVAFVMNLLRLLLTLQCTGDASVWCESSDCVQCCIWHHKDCIDGEKVLTQNNIK